MAASERKALATSIASTISDYREGEIDRPTQEHVERWLKQFKTDVQIPLLRELDHVLNNTYYGREKVRKSLDRLVRNPQLAGSNPARFWAGVNFLDIQEEGKSQSDLLFLFTQTLNEVCKLEFKECGSAGGPFVYLDDVLCTGASVGKALSDWLAQDAPQNPTVHVLVIATHTRGEYEAGLQLQDKADATHKNLDLKIWHDVRFENLLINRDNSEVLWPVSLPDDPAIREYVSAEKKFPFKPRKAGGKFKSKIFSSEAGRHALEQAMLVEGTRIWAACKDPSSFRRPLGYSRYGLGFGSTIVTFRNCPNNAPLALWWPYPDAAPGSAPDWYPLMARKLNAPERDPSSGPGAMRLFVR